MGGIFFQTFCPSVCDDFEEGTGGADGEEDADGDEEEAMALSGGE